MSVRILPLLLVLAVASCAGPSQAGPVATAAVDLPRSYLFVPANIAIPTGTTVTWMNRDQFSHTVRIFEGPASVGTDLLMKPGEKVALTFTQPGLYRYDCAFHSQNMRGSVTVGGSISLLPEASFDATAQQMKEGTHK